MTKLILKLRVKGRIFACRGTNLTCQTWSFLEGPNPLPYANDQKPWWKQAFVWALWATAQVIHRPFHTCPSTTMASKSLAPCSIQKFGDVFLGSHERPQSQYRLHVSYHECNIILTVLLLSDQVSICLKGTFCWFTVLSTKWDAQEHSILGIQTFHNVNRMWSQKVSVLTSPGWIALTRLQRMIPRQGCTAHHEVS